MRQSGISLAKQFRSSWLIMTISFMTFDNSVKSHADLMSAVMLNVFRSFLIFVFVAVVSGHALAVPGPVNSGKIDPLPIPIPPFRPSRTT